MIALPELFTSKLAEKPALSAVVSKTLDAFEPWLEQSGMPFFPGFTDHSPRHIREVLETAASLIADDCRSLVSPEDCTVLCIAILLHDCGMHLTQDGFRNLILGDSPVLCPQLGDRPWSLLWNEFKSEAARFDQVKLKALFGDDKPVVIKNLDLNNLGDRDLLLVGEFVRRHHARIAHEIAIAGVPGPRAERLRVEGLSKEFLDLSGLAARSHGAPLRHFFPYLKKRYASVPQFQGAKLPFLMAILRVADYIQVQSERAIANLLLVKELRSPVSRQEWRAHFAVRDVSVTHEDPEALYVNAKPEDVKTFLKLTHLFRDIQRELDESWAVLGEVYGRLSPLSSLGMTIRRIRSNIDDVSEFASTVDYLPVKAGFNSSGADLLKLLVGPLYSYNPSVGVRELIQNAVDACRERADATQSALGEDRQQDVDVLLSMKEDENGERWLSVQDKGVGMTLDTVLNYFLVAGASFRNSEVWRKQHIDDQGKSRVMRGGRFGVGVLGAFLLGEEIEVETRHFLCSPEEGLQFRASIDEPAIELKRKTLPVGTSIAIRVKDDRIWQTLSFHSYRLQESNRIEGDVYELEEWPGIDWYRQASPTLRYEFDGKVSNKRVRARLVPRKDLVPTSTVEGDWKALVDPSPYRAVFWYYPSSEPRKTRDTTYWVTKSCSSTVNGIHVSNHDSHVSLSDDAVGHGVPFSIRRPSLAIMDPGGECPINLQRDAIAFDQMGLDERLSGAVLGHFIQNLISINSPCESLPSVGSLMRAAVENCGITWTHSWRTAKCLPFFVTKAGLMLADPTYIAQAGVSRLIVAESGVLELEIPLSALQEGEGLLLTSFGDGISGLLGWFRAVFAFSSDEQQQAYFQSSCGFPWFSSAGAAGMLSPSDWKLITQPGKVAKWLIDSMEKAPKGVKGYEVITRGQTTEAELDRLRAMHETFQRPRLLGIVELATHQAFRGTSLLAKHWQDAIGGPVLKFTR